MSGLRQYFRWLVLDRSWAVVGPAVESGCSGLAITSPEPVCKLSPHTGNKRYHLHALQGELDR